MNELIMTRIWIENNDTMEQIVIELRKNANWPLVGNRFVAWKEDDDIILTIKINKVGLLIMRANGTLIATTPDYEIMIDYIKMKLWLKSGIC